MRIFLLALLLLAASPLAEAQTCSTVTECQDIIWSQFAPQWTNGGASGFRQAMRDACLSDTFVYHQTHHCPQIVYRDEETELPTIVLGEPWPTDGALPNRDDAPTHRGQSTVKNVFLATNPATGQPYVDISGLSHCIRLTAHEKGNEKDYAAGHGEDIGYWLELCIKVSNGVSTGLRCYAQGEDRASGDTWVASSHNSGAWYAPTSE